MLVASLDPEIYLKSQRTRNRLVDALVETIETTLAGPTNVTRMNGHRLSIDTPDPTATDRLTRIFGIRAVETVELLDASDLGGLAASVARLSGPQVTGRTFAVRPHRLGRHQWSSQDLAVAAGRLLVEAGGIVNLSEPDVTVAVRIVGENAYLTMDTVPGVGGLPVSTQGRVLAMFSGGIDSPVAAYLIAHRGVATDYVHFSLGCGAADHAAAVAHLLFERYGAGTDPMLHIADLEPAAAQIQRRVPARQRQMALKGVMYRASAMVASTRPGTAALITGESLGQVSTQTLANVAALDRLVGIPVLRPLIGLDKDTISAIARRIGTFDVSSRTRELCDIAGGARVSVATSPAALAVITADLDDVVEQAVLTLKSMRLADWIPGT
jgi:thiamine biosynthesis protein ThiI